jgi:hypothetical protein
MLLTVIKIEGRCISRFIVWLHSNTDSKPFWFWPYLIPNISYSKPFWFWPYLIPNISYSKPFWFRAYLFFFPNPFVLNLSDYETFWFWTYLVPNLSSSEPFCLRTYLDPNLRSEPVCIRTCVPNLSVSEPAFLTCLFPNLFLLELVWFRTNLILNPSVIQPIRYRIWALFGPTPLFRLSVPLALQSWDDHQPPPSAPWRNWDQIGQPQSPLLSAQDDSQPFLEIAKENHFFITYLL